MHEPKSLVTFRLLSYYVYRHDGVVTVVVCWRWQVSLTNMLGIGPLLMYVIMRYGSNIPTDDAVGAANPSLATYFKDIAGSAVVVEILFFYAHRALHFKSIYGECSDVHVGWCPSDVIPLVL